MTIAFKELRTESFSFKPVTSRFLRLVETADELMIAIKTKEPVVVNLLDGSMCSFPVYEDIPGATPIDDEIAAVIEYGSRYQRAIKSKAPSDDPAEMRDEIETIAEISPHPVVKNLCAYWLSNAGNHQSFI